MSQANYSLALLLVGGVLLGSCGGDAHTNTPSHTLGTDSAAAKVGGTPPVPIDTTATGATR